MSDRSPQISDDAIDAEKKRDARAEGGAARIDGLVIGQCPYDEGNPLRREWRLGWLGWFDKPSGDTKPRRGRT